MNKLVADCNFRLYVMSFVTAIHMHGKMLLYFVTRRFNPLVSLRTFLCFVNDFLNKLIIFLFLLNPNEPTFVNYQSVLLTGSPLMISLHFILGSSPLKN